jgi:hypothetical protein
MYKKAITREVVRSGADNQGVGLLITDRSHTSSAGQPFVCWVGASLKILVAATSSARLLSGFCTATTFSPCSSSKGMTVAQLFTSGHAPCTRTT